ncbi:hypothetical protein C1645_820102 [Glomus cerebriforme]|uniref:Uncharacterized protein n=1 Tax=Glomus cerebriforme TaxID=658196 RepID=A0A397T964_9GLOM|nr:hypothetical protein C1645_820102 [Glomus cerebriforme]
MKFAFHDPNGQNKTLQEYTGALVINSMRNRIRNDYYVITDEDLGTGSSGAPWIMDYDPSTNLGHLCGNVQFFDNANDETISPIYSEEN